MNQSVVLIGFKACGKTTVGRLLAQTVQAQFIDTDQVLEAHHGVTGPELYRTVGAQAFRALEKDVITELTMTAAGAPRVIATGGGVVLEPKNRAMLRQLGQVVYLFTSYATLLSRLQGQPIPAFMSGDLATGLQTLFAEREPLYRETADWICNTENNSVTEVVAQLMRQYL